MATLTHFIQYPFRLFPLDLLLSPVSVIRTNTLITYKLLDDTVMKVSGNFSISGSEIKAGNVTKLELFDSGVKQLSLSGLKLSYDSLMQVAADATPEALLSGGDSIVGSTSNDLLWGYEGNDGLFGGAGNDRIYGGIGNDVLFGEAGQDILLAGSGDDYLNGGWGADRMLGGGGSDTYIVDHASDKVVEWKNSGIDTVETGLASYTLTGNVENLTYKGNSNFTGTGNSLENTIIGGAKNDTLNGKAGDDFVRGGNGNDILRGEWGNDTLIGDAGANVLTTLSSTSYNNKPISISLSLPEVSTKTSTTATGYVSRNEVSSDVVNLAFVLDVSGSMDALFSGNVNVGDQNNDGQSNTRLDAAILSFEKMIDSIKNAGLASTVNIAVIPFQSSSTTAITASVTQDADGNGVADVLDAVRALNEGGGTDYNSGLLQAINFFENIEEGANSMFFLSDGSPGLQNYDASLDQLKDANGINANIRAISLGAGSQYNTLDLMDDGLLNASADQVIDPTQLSISISSSDVDSSLVSAVQIFKNGVKVKTVWANNLTETPFGLRYSVSIDDLKTVGNDKIEAKLVFKDGSINSISTHQYITVGTLLSDDTLYGGVGNDILDGGAGLDTMYGGTGNDIYRVDRSVDKTIEKSGEGVDTIETTVSLSLTSRANIENLDLLGSENLWGAGNWGANIIVGNSGNNVLTGNGGADTLNGAAGYDTANYAGATAAVTVNLLLGTATGGHGADTLINIENIKGSAYADNLSGDDEDNKIEGNNGNDILYGDDGDDVLIGGSGNDSLNGYYGDDTLNGGSGDNILNGYYGLDTVDYTSAVQGITVSLNAYGDATVITGQGTDTLDNIESVFGSKFNDLLVSTATSSSYYVNSFKGYGGNDIIIAGAGNDYLNGGDGADQLQGEAGDDNLIGGAGNDIINGGLGVDTADYRTSMNALVVNLSSGIATGLGTDTLVGIENILGGVRNDTLVGNALNNSLYGGIGWGSDILYGYAGDDVLDGGIGKDKMFGGAGADTYYIDNVGDVVTEVSSLGIDTVISAVGFTLGSYVENLTMTGVNATTGKGNSLANTIIASDAGSTIFGFNGVDNLVGGAGVDNIDGGYGNDFIDGKEGIDFAKFNSINSAVTVTLSSGDGNSTGQGSDSILNIEGIKGSNQSDTFSLSGYTYYSAAYFGYTVYALGGADHLTGGSYIDYLDGGDGNDTINAGSGDDVLIGGNGNDYLNGESGSHDTVKFNASTAKINLNLATGQATGQGTDTILNIENIVGSQYGDSLGWISPTTYTYTDYTIEGMGGWDTLTGSRGDDVLNGGLGVDTMTGGLGDDTYYVDNLNDKIIENISEGVDTVISTINFSLSSEALNDLTLIGGAIVANGNTGVNTIIGNEHNNTIRGYAGNDTLVGGSGADVLVGGTGADIFDYNLASESTFNVSVDLIKDFNAIDGDKIDLRDLDANIFSNYDQAFTFIGAAEFNEVAELRYEVIGTTLHLQGDIDGDGIADLDIGIAGISTIGIDSIIL